MLRAGVGLTGVHLDDLKKALSALHHGQFRFPLTIEDLTRVGLQHCANDLLEMTRELDERGLRAVLVAVIAERLPANKDRRWRAG